jgi:hypothetical protein
MSHEFEESIRLAAECYVDRFGVDGTIAALNDRRDEEPRAAEALAYVKREYTTEADA